MRAKRLETASNQTQKGLKWRFWTPKPIQSPKNGPSGQWRSCEPLVFPQPAKRETGQRKRAL